MLELSKQVCSLDLSKKLKELGVKQDSLFYWVSFDPKGIKDWRGPYMKTDVGLTYAGTHYFDNDDALGGAVSAFTVAELGEMLPQIIKIKGIRYQLFISVGMDKQFFVVYADEQDYNNNAPFSILMCHNEADARAKCLIWLIEQGYITG